MSRRERGPASAAAAAPVFAALGDETRLALVARLCSRGPASISRLTAGSRVTRQAITKHLQVLADAGLVHDVRRGRERIWELEAARLSDAREWLDAISAQWDEALERLRKLVEES
jgi:DNA-binding transcriptional ArsR family regulator